MLTVLRILPMLFAAYYFSKSKSSFTSNKAMVVLPLLAMLVFWTNSAGAGAWYYGLFWTIPIGVIAINMFADNVATVKLLLSMVGDVLSKIPVIGRAAASYPRLFLLSLGATFTAHAVGNIIWTLTVPMTSAQWALLVPITATERLIFALGISISYVFFANVLNTVDKVLDIQKYVSIDKNYVLQLF
jgi:hypothetical protein